MSRHPRSVGARKPDYLLDHVLSPHFQDSPLIGRIGLPPNRLSRYLGEMDGGWGGVAELISGPERWDAKWFPDANTAILPMASDIWTAFRVAAIGTASRPVVISGVVEEELRAWIMDPYRDKGLAQNIRVAMDRRTWIDRYRIGPTSPIGAAVWNYIHLLGFRRLLCHPCSDGLTLMGTDPTDAARTMGVIEQSLGKRAMSLAKKGREDLRKGNPANISDELHCMMCIVYAITNGVNSFVLTADSDCLEIFQKAQWFLDTHYRAWLVSKAILDGEYGPESGRLTRVDGYFEGPLSLYRWRSARMEELLPRFYESVLAGVVYVSPTGPIRIMSFTFERAMIGMLETRGKTAGRCAESLGGRNVHIDLGPLKRELDGMYIGVGVDTVIPFVTMGRDSPVSKLDLEHSIHNQERSIVISRTGG